jgi:hypothetical protein
MCSAAEMVLLREVIVKTYVFSIVSGGMAEVAVYNKGTLAYTKRVSLRVARRLAHRGHEVKWN